MADNRILCLASEKGKIVVNTCLSRKIFINTLKLERLLILMHGIMLGTHHKPLFNQNVTFRATSGLMIDEVDRDFIMYAAVFNEPLQEYICLLDEEEKILQHIIEFYGNFNVFQLDELGTLRILRELCYEKTKSNKIPNEIIKDVFTQIDLYSLTYKKNKSTFKR